jgi:alpha-aminoadipic semialdehyde synthase
MIDTLWTLGRRLRVLGLETPLAALKPAHAYDSLDECKAAIARVGEGIAAGELPAELAPVVFGITGYGNVSRGAQEILDILPHVEVDPADLPAFVEGNRTLRDKVAKTVYHEEHLVERSDPSREFDLQEYYDHPERYRSRFRQHLDLITVLVNGIYWDTPYPRLADATQLKELFSGPDRPRLTVVGDITCDVDGSLACTVRDTEPGDPVYVYDPATGEAPSGFEGPGLAVMAVGNLPCELPREASITFSEALKPFIPALAAVDLESGFEEADLPGPIRRSVILWRGEFTPDYLYMKDFLD